MANPTPLFNVPRLPGRLTAEQAAALLGFELHDIPVLVRDGLLKPLGSPKPSAPKKFATVDIEEKIRDVQWLSKATKTVSAEWLRRKANRFTGNGSGLNGRNR
jgi:hypothetical protein